MKHARVIFEGREHTGTAHDFNGQADAAVRLDDGRVVPQEQLVWLPPLAPTPRPRTILALGLNYADHAKELEFKAPEEPLVFIKGQSTLIGHRQFTHRPAGEQFMHYECELAIVVGKTAKHVKRDDACDFIGGYTVANDYAIRDYLENWYRPNLRVKNRDGATPLGPWLVDAKDVPDPMGLALQTTVNGQDTQSGNTKDMIFDVPFLIYYFSSFMTLNPGDLILTGTPDGVVDCKPGDVVLTQIEGIGALMNTIQ
jgi:5-oxopent-3-ene-1,2,5-tricarboxylate decarboxylase/2-hydroxyhepta-2,4-diene-1,7-dioate isomerase